MFDRIEEAIIGSSVQENVLGRWQEPPKDIYNKLIRKIPIQTKEPIRPPNLLYAIQQPFKLA